MCLHVWLVCIYVLIILTRLLSVGFAPGNTCVWALYDVNHHYQLEIMTVTLCNFMVNKDFDLILI